MVVKPQGRPAIYICQGCGHEFVYMDRRPALLALFPPKVRCPQCGGADLKRRRGIIKNALPAETASDLAELAADAEDPALGLAVEATGLAPKAFAKNGPVSWREFPIAAKRPVRSRP